jgi:hypothetical protein
VGLGMFIGVIITVGYEPIYSLGISITGFIYLGSVISLKTEAWTEDKTHTVVDENDINEISDEQPDNYYQSDIIIK